MFVAYLKAQSLAETYGVECFDDRNRFGRKPLWSYLTDCPRICLDGLKKITSNLGQDSQCPDLGAKWVPTEYKSVFLLLGLFCLK